MSSQVIPDWRGLKRSDSNWRTVQKGSTPRLRASAGENSDSYNPLPASFSQTPPGGRRFIANKGSTAIRKYCQKTVEALFFVFYMPNRVSFGLSFILFSKTSHQTHLNQQRNVVLYHLFALVSRENWLGLLKKATLIFAHVCFAQTWARDDKGRFVWTVEHVLPKAEKLPDHWVKMIAEGDRQKAADLQDKWVHRLGNLTLSGYNSDLGTTSFEKKQKLSKDRNILGHKIDIGYRNNLFLNSLAFKTKAAKYSLADAPHWDAQMIEARTNVLVDMIADANLLPGEKASRKR